MGWLRRNLEFIRSSDLSVQAGLCALLLVQAAGSAYWALRFPFHYDEWFSLNFSANSYWTVISWYPLPNNHVFFNLLSRTFIITGLPVQCAARLPSLLASILTVYYFYKVCRHDLPAPLSILLTAAFQSLYVIAVYSALARGYALMNLFVVLMFYSCQQLVERGPAKRYLWLFGSSIFLGMFTMPNFLYALIPVAIVAAVYGCRRHGMRWLILFGTVTAVAGLLTVLAYVPILTHNDAGNLLHPNGAKRFSLSDPGAYQDILYYLNLLFYELFRNQHLYLSAAAVLLVLAIELLRLKGQLSFTFLTAVVFFFSPYFILLVHQTFPWGRNWQFMALPYLLCAGFMVNSVTAWLRIERWKSTAPLVVTVALFLTIYRCCGISGEHRRSTAWDYQLDFLWRHSLAPLPSIASVATSNVAGEFYPAEELLMMIRHLKRQPELQMQALNADPDQQLLIVDHSVLPALRAQLGNYRFAYMHSGVYFFLRRRQ